MCGQPHATAALPPKIGSRHALFVRLANHIQDRINWRIKVAATRRDALCLVSGSRRFEGPPCLPSSVSSGPSSLGSLSNEVEAPTRLNQRRGPVAQRQSVASLNPTKRRCDNATSRNRHHVLVQSPKRNVLTRRSELLCLRLLRVGSRNKLGGRTRLSKLIFCFIIPFSDGNSRQLS